MKATSTIPDCITLASALVGILAIMYILDGAYKIGIILILVAIVLDGLDGRIARMLKKEHELGRYLDSLADSISFCLAPAILLYKSYYSLERGTAFYNLENASVIAAVVLVVGCGILRLARFTSGKEDSLKFFNGLPTPAMAFIVIASYQAVSSPIVLLPLSILSLLMVSKIRYPKINTLPYMLGGLCALTLAFLSAIWIRELAIGALAIILLYALISPMATKYSFIFQKERKMRGLL